MHQVNPKKVGVAIIISEKEKENIQKIKKEQAWKLHYAERNHRQQTSISNKYIHSKCLSIQIHKGNIIWASKRHSQPHNSNRRLQRPTISFGKV